MVCPRRFGGVKEEEERKPGLHPEMRCSSEKMQEMGGVCWQRRAEVTVGGANVLTLGTRERIYQLANLPYGPFSDRVSLVQHSLSGRDSGT